jgi:quinol monooxygenase YgiN
VESLGTAARGVFYEVYADAAAHDDQQSRPHTHVFLTAVRALVSSIRVEALTEV